MLQAVFLNQVDQVMAAAVVACRDCNLSSRISTGLAMDKKSTSFG